MILSRKLYGLSIAMYLAMALPVNAQQTQLTKGYHDQMMEASQRLHSLPVYNLQGHKGTAMKQRIIKWEHYIGDVSPFLASSVSYQYSSNRGSTFDPITLQFSEMPKITGTYRDLTQSQVLADSIHYANNGGYFHDITRKFTTGNHILSEDQVPGYEAPFLNGMRSRREYGTNGYVNSVLLYRLLGNNQWDTAQLRKLTYNTAGFITADSTFTKATNSWRLYTTTTYVHNPQGNLLREVHSKRIGNLWIDENEFTNTYDASGNKAISRISYFRNSLGRIEYGYRDSLEYSTALPLFTKRIIDDWDTTSNTWTRQFLHERHYNSQALPDTISISRWTPFINDWTPSIINVITYNGYGNPEKASYYSPAWGLREYADHHYELYDDVATSITGAAKKKIEAIVYPNPAQDQLHLKLPATERGKQVSVVITDVSGRMLSAESLQWGQAVESFHIGHLLPAVYFITIQTTDGTMQQSFIKK